MSIQLRPYQQNLVTDIYKQWQHVQSVIGVMPTGAGKAYTLSYIVREFMTRGNKVVVQVHRRELIGQLSCSLATLGVVHNIIGSKATIEFVKQLHIEQFGRIFIDGMAKVCLASVQTLIGKKGVENWASSVGLKVTDECFIAGTLIDGVPIENIKVGDHVTAYDQGTNSFAKKRVTRLFKNEAPDELVMVKTCDGKTVTCTKNHPFWTQNRGWVDAVELELTDLIYHRTEDGKFYYHPLEGAVVLPSLDTDYVYNIEVEDYHTYVANDVVVHNCHHVLKENTWGRCWDLFPQAYGLGVTATPQRTDNFGLGAHADGVFDRMVIGPTMRELINMGNLSEYKVFVPPTDFKVGSLKTGSNGEYTAASVEEALTGSHVVGDAVNHYMRFMPNEPGIVFASSLDRSDEIAAAFNASGIPAASVSSKDSDEHRAKAMRDFKSGKLKVLSNFALYDEGVDVPGLTGVIDCAPSKSLIKFHQRFGRMLRKSPGKSHGIYIDMVSNIKIENRGTHALPDSPMLWSLDRRKGRSSEEENNILKLTSCLSCFQPYLSSDSMCPHCGTPKPVPTVRGSTGPIEIDDQLVELTPQRCAALRGEIDEARMDSNEWMVDKFGTYASGIIPMKQRKNHKQRKETLLSLDDSIANWAGVMRDFGMSDDEIRHGFQREFGLSIYEARVLKRADADKLISKLVL